MHGDREGACYGLSKPLVPASIDVAALPHNACSTPLRAQQALHGACLAFYFSVDLKTCRFRQTWVPFRLQF